MKLRVVLRLLQIQRVLVRHGLDDFIRATHLYRPLRFVLLPLARGRGSSAAAGLPRGERLRLALEELGPIFVKFGQALSTRRDLLPADIADELAKLQDRVPPFPGAEARALIEAAYGRPSTRCSRRSTRRRWRRPRSRRCMRQRCAAGEEVVVKVLRPGMREVIERDLEVLHALAGLAERYWPEGGGCGRSRSCANTRRPSSTSST